jgi:hypothetical protein
MTSHLTILVCTLFNVFKSESELHTGAQFQMASSKTQMRTFWSNEEKGKVYSSGKTLA